MLVPSATPLDTAVTALMVRVPVIVAGAVVVELVVVRAVAVGVVCVA